MPGFIGVQGILMLGLVLLLVFGPRRLPEMTRSMGRGVRELKDSLTGGETIELVDAAAEPEPRHTTR